MANILAAQTGNYGTGSTWVGSVVPGSADIAYANGFNITIDATYTVGAISNASGTGITAGGSFIPANGCNLTCVNATGIIQGVTGNSTLAPNVSSGQTATVSGNLLNQTTVANTYPVNYSSAGTFNFNGNTTGASTAGATFYVSGSGTLNTTGTITVNGGTGNASNHGILLVSGGVVNHTGSIAGGSYSNGAYNTGTGTININGSVSGGGTNAVGAQNNGTGTINITGTVTGGYTANSYGAQNSGGGTLTVTGSCVSGSAAAAIGPGASNQNTRLSGPFIVGVSSLNPVVALTWKWTSTQIPTYYEVLSADGVTRRNLYTSDNIPSANYPSALNVRLGTKYGPNLENTGTCAVPSASAVALGTPVDNSTGTAILSASSLLSALGLASGNLDTQFAAIPAAVRTNLTTELARLDAAVSSRLAPNGTLARVTLVDYTNTLINAPVVPQPGDVAAAVWGASTRSLTTAFPSIPSPSDNAAAVWGASIRSVTNLTQIAQAIRTDQSLELGRIANCATVETTANALSDALSQ